MSYCLEEKQILIHIHFLAAFFILRKRIRLKSHPAFYIVDSKAVIVTLALNRLINDAYSIIHIEITLFVVSYSAVIVRSAFFIRSEGFGCYTERNIQLFSYVKIRPKCLKLILCRIAEAQYINTLAYTHNRFSQRTVSALIPYRMIPGW